MRPEEFLSLMSGSGDAELLDLCLRSSIPPFVFEPDPAAWDSFRSVIANNLTCATEDIQIVGSARLGISLKPHKNLRQFSDKSDIDIAIVNADLFDEFWVGLLRAAYPRPPNPPMGGALARRRAELYTGWLTPTKIRLDVKVFGSKALPILNLRTRWFNTMKEAARLPPRRHEDVQARLYRTWNHAEMYHLNSLAALRRSLEV
jgi:hypothetical protein